MDEATEPNNHGATTMVKYLQSWNCIVYKITYTIRVLPTLVYLSVLAVFRI